MALDAVLAAARERLAAAERAARKAEADSHLSVIGLKWAEALAIRREVQQLERQAQQQPVKPVVRAPASPPRAASLPDPKLVAAEMVRQIRAAVSAQTATLRAENAELRRELAVAQQRERQARGKLAAVTSVASVARRRAA